MIVFPEEKHTQCSVEPMWRVLYYSYSDVLAEISSTLAQENHKIYRSEECERMPLTETYQHEDFHIRLNLTEEMSRSHFTHQILWRIKDKQSEKISNY